MEYWQDDKHLEEAMLKSSMLFIKAKINDKRSLLFEKYLLSIFFSGRAKNVEDIITLFSNTHQNIYIDKTQVKSALDSLVKDKILECDKDGNYSISEKKQSEATTYTNEILLELDHVVTDIFNTLKKNYSNTNNKENQIKTNIKSCLNYYFKVASLYYFNLDSQKDLSELEKLSEIASEGLNGLDELRDQIIFAVGSIINNPNDNQSHALEIMARIHVTAQMMNIDPLLSKFKATQIKGKTFILDTDVVLHAITDNASYSKQYELMIRQLLKCGCLIYIPYEIITEVYNHAEASLKRYPFVSNMIGLKDEDAPKLFKNVFIEDFHNTKILNPGKHITWEGYISNYFDKEHGISMTADVIEEALGDRINYGKLPNHSEIDEKESEQLYNLVLEETQKTDKANHRAFEKNEDIAKADTQIYLIVKQINKDNANTEPLTKGKKNILHNDCYFLSSSNRVHYCAKTLGLDADISCNPKALLAYLAETGYVEREKVLFTKLFDNPFLIYTAKLVEDDIDALLRVHVDLSESKIVRMRYDLSDEIHKSLTIKNANEYQQFYDDVKQKGYKFNSTVTEIMESHINDQKKIDNLLCELAEAQKKLEEKDKQLASKDKKIGNLEYQKRIGINIAKKKKNEKIIKSRQKNNR